MSKKQSPKQKPRRRTSLIIRPASFSPVVRSLIQLPTPQEFIKQRPGKGSKQFTYVEGGYVIARLNQMFKNCWDFEIIDERVEPKEVVVRGKLVVKDFKSGYEVSKTHYGTKTRYAEVPLGDTLKAAATDCLKKCASLFGIALDVYWQQLDEDKLAPVKGKVSNAPVKKSNKELMDMSLAKIKEEKDPFILMEFKKRIENSKLYGPNEKVKLTKAIDKRIKINVEKDEDNSTGSLF